MKKLFAMMLALLLLMSYACAGSLDDLLPKPSGLLPDPCLAVTEDAFVGTLYRENFTLGTDYVCDAYLYPRVNNSFLKAYTRVLQNFGYSIVETQVDGRDGYSIQCGDGKQAMMVLDFNSQMLFLVEKGMEFILTDVMTVTYNGVDYQMYRYITDTPNSYPYDSWGAQFRMENGPFDRLGLNVPKDVRAGFSYESRGDKTFDGLKMSVWRGNSGDYLLYDSWTWTRQDRVDSSKDFAYVQIDYVEDTEYGRMIVGSFEASFSSGEMIFENGKFSMMISD